MSWSREEALTDPAVREPIMFTSEFRFRLRDIPGIRRMLRESGFRDIQIETVAKLNYTARAADAAIGLVEGNPIALAIAERDASLRPVVIDAVAKAIKEQFGETDIRAPMKAIVVRAQA
jgi:hypothetical protein